MRVATKIVAALLAAVAVTMCLSATPVLADTAIVLCKVNAEACKKENYAGEAFTATSEATFNFGELGTFKCSSTMSRNEAGQLSSLTVTGCSEGCEVKASNLPYGTSLVNPSGGNGKINIFSGGSGEPKLGILCGAIECVYGAATIEAEFKGGSPASVVVSKSLTRKTESFLCPKTPKWEATYKFTSPATAVYMLKRTIEGPVFCLANEKICPQKLIENYLESERQSGTSFKVTKLVGGVVSCSSGFLELEDTNLYESGPFIYREIISKCTHPTYTSCTVSYDAKNFPYGYLFPSGGGNGEVVVKAGKTGNPTLSIKCLSGGSPFECKYSTEEFGLEFKGGEPATLQEIGSMTRTEGSATFCPASIVVQASYVTPLGFGWYMTEA